MVIYEVNVSVDNKIYTSYYNWLIEHIKEILKIEGFQKAEVTKEKSDTNQYTTLIVRYELKSESDLENYFQNHANILRQDAIKRFGDDISITRRILIEPVLITI